VPDLINADMPVRWWQIAIIGIIILISGIDAFFWTPVFMGILSTLFGILALAVGVIMVAFSFAIHGDIVFRFPIFFAGLLSLMVSAVSLLLPGLIGMNFMVIMAFLAIINSVLLILVGCSLPDAWKVRLVIVLLGMLTLFMSILMALFPTLSAFDLVRIWGIYAVIIGFLCLIAGVSMKIGTNSKNGAGKAPVLV